MIRFDPRSMSFAFLAVGVLASVPANRNGAAPGRPGAGAAGRGRRAPLFVRPPADLDEVAAVVPLEREPGS